MKNFHRPDGVSLLISMVFVSILMVVMAGVYAVTQKALESIHNRDMGSQVRYLSESAQELGLAMVNAQPIGWNNVDDKDYPNDRLNSLIWKNARDLGISWCDKKKGQFDDVNKPCASVQILGRSQDKATVKMSSSDQQEAGTAYYSVPLAYIDSVTGNDIYGTGDVGAGKCDDKFGADSPCTWNKIYLGQSAEIPLYYVDASNKNNPVVKKLTDFKLRVRAPCMNSAVEDCEPGDFAKGRELYPLASAQVKPYAQVMEDQVLLQWLISDQSGDQILTAKDSQLDGVRKPLIGINQNTEISSGRLNDAIPSPKNMPSLNLDNYNVLVGSSHKGKDLTTAPTLISGFLNSATKPLLRITMVNRPLRPKDEQNPSQVLTSDEKNSHRYDVPFLEYQVLTPTSQASDAKSVVAGWVEANGIRRDFTLSKSRPASLSGFALENF